jgi:GTP diphosphokinase / guanosine-3',5'-bis(diphosphate) 3'-diphosphatase
LKKLIETINKTYSAEQIKQFNKVFLEFKKAKEASKYKDLFKESFTSGIESAKILCQVKIDIDSILAALCMPAIKRNLIKAEDIGLDKHIIKLIEDASEFDNIIYDETQLDNANLRAMFVNMSKDIRTLIIKLAEITVSAQNMSGLNKDQKDHLHKEINQIYAPLAARLGLSFIKSVLQDENFKYLEPEKYEYLKKEISEGELQRKIALNKMIKRLIKLLKDLKIEGQVFGRIKHLSSINKKLNERAAGNLKNVQDLVAVRIIVENVNECYALLGEVHARYTPVENMFRDYIAKPKANGYRSLHTTIYFEDNQIIEVQIRTEEMHYFAEYGVAAHWLYKEKKTKQNTLDKKLTWIRQILENTDSLTANEIIDELKTDDYAGEIYVQTPKGNIIELPTGATPIDFAYTVHSEVGNKCTGAKVNGKMVPLTTVLNNGEIVEIITSSNSKGPSRDWLKFVKSSAARNKINAYFKKERREENIKRGKNILEQTAKHKNLQLHKLFEERYLKEVYEKYSLTGLEDLYANVGHGALTATQVFNKLTRAEEEQNAQTKKLELPKVQNLTTKEPKSDVIVIKGLNNLLIRFAKCCTPIPGDEIVGYVSRGKGATIHRTNCKSLKQLEKERLIQAEWGELEENSNYQAEINLIVKNASGALAAITNKIAELKVNILAVSANQISGDRNLINLVVSINKTEQLQELMNKLKTISAVYEVYRANER